jgi:MtrB/PioB family decaheme-associated outer membrane protein
MTKRHSLRAVLLAGACLAPLAAAAQDYDIGGAATITPPVREFDNSVDFGIRYQNNSSPVFGRYNGYPDKGFSTFGGFDLNWRPAPNTDDTFFFSATGRNVDFEHDGLGKTSGVAPEGEVNASFGQQGTWKAKLFYDAITYTGQTFFTPYDKDGGLAAGLVPFGGATRTAAGAIGSTYYVTHPLPEIETTAGTRRDIVGGNGKYIYGDWTVLAGVRHEHKEGTLAQTMYQSGGGFSGTPFLEPVSYDTDRYEASLAYNTKRLQAQLGYVYSKFTDANSAFSVPYFVTGSTSAAPQLTAQYSLPPSNDAHYVTGTAGYNLTNTTRITGGFRVGIESSNSPLGTGTATPGSTLAAAYNFSNLAANPSTSDQLAETYNGRLQVTARPISKLELKASYGVDGRSLISNPVTLFEVARPEAGASTTPNTIGSQDWTKQKVQLEAGYRIIPSTKVTLGYQYDNVDRSAGNAVGGQASPGYWTGHSDENTVSVKLASSILQAVNGSIAYEHAVRSGQFEFVAPLDSGAFYQAPRTADRVKLRTDYMPIDEVTLGINGKLENNRYRYQAGQTGVKEDSNASIGPDVTYMPTKAVTLYGFYTFQQIYYNNFGNGCPSSGTTPGTAGSCPSGFSQGQPANGFGFNAATTDVVHTAGVSADWKPIDRLKIKFGYTFSYGDVTYNMFDGLSAPVTLFSYENIQNLPKVSSSMHSLRLTGEYEMADNVSLLAGYSFDLFKDNDWAYGWNPLILANSTAGGGTTVNSVNTLTSGESQPTYRVHSLFTGVRVRF